MKTDIDIKRDLEAELRWSPELDEKDVAVKVTDRTVTLTGFVHTFFEKHQAELAAKRVAGVAAVANDIEVRSSSIGGLSDPEIAREIVGAMKWELPVAHENIKVLVERGHVTIEGKVEWQFQRERAENTVRRQRGVTAVSNRLQIAPRVSATDVKRKIEDALRRSAEIDANRIAVEARGGEVTLSGNVRSWIEREEAQRTVWSAPGVTQVRNEIVVSG